MTCMVQLVLTKLVSSRKFEFYFQKEKFKLGSAFQPLINTVFPVVVGLAVSGISLIPPREDNPFLTCHLFLTTRARAVCSIIKTCCFLKIKNIKTVNHAM